MIRTATVEDLPSLLPLASAFSAVAGRKFVPERFVHSWTTLIESELAAIFLQEKEGVIQGMLGGLAMPDLYNGDIVVTEAFWWIQPEYRGGTIGFGLYRAFERWCTEKCCTEIRMVHLEDSMPRQLESFYHNMGYRKIETHYALQIQRFEPKEAA